MNNKFLILLFVIPIILAPFSIAYVQESCTSIYDNFTDSSFNKQLWINNTAVVEQNNYLNNTIGGGILIPNMSLPKTVNKFGALGARGGCVYLNFSIYTGSGGTNVSFWLSNTEGESNKSLAIWDAAANNDRVNVSFNMWQDDEIVYYIINMTNGTTVRETTGSTSVVRNKVYYPEISGKDASSNTWVYIWTANINASGLIIVNVTDEQNSSLRVPYALTVQKLDNESSTIKTHANWTLFTSYDRLTQIYFTGGGYASRTFTLTDLSNDITYLNAYLLNQTSSNVQLVTFTVKSTEGSVLEGVNVTISKLYGTSLVNLSNFMTNFQGQFLQYMDYTTNYNFHLQYGDQTKDFNLYPTSTTYTILFNIVVDYGDYAQNLSNVLQYTDGTIYYNNNTLNLSFNFSQTATIADNFCLRIINTTNGTYPTQISLECASGASGSVVYHAAENNTLYAQGLANLSGSYILIASKLISTYSDNSLFFDKEGVWVSALLLMVVVLVGTMIAGAVTGVVFTVVGLILVNLLGVMKIGISAIIGLILVGLIFVVMLARRER